ncbi:MAG: hypothetical protein AAF806_09150 [Bacteroidota bacterium]
MISSCDRPTCNNTNRVFDENEPTSLVYKTELAEQLNKIDQSKLRYWLKSYENRKDREYLHFWIQSDEICASLALTVQDWEGLEKLRTQRGKSYINAEFTNVKFEISADAIKPEFIYKNFGSIID